VSFARFGKNKRYDLQPELLDIHVPRMIEAHRVAGSYMTPSELLNSGMIRIENFLGKAVAGEIKAQAEKSAIKDGQSNESRIGSHPNSLAAHAMTPIWNVIAPLFQPVARGEAQNLFVGNSYLQHLYNLPEDGDEQKVFHSDTFFPCVKFWYFPHSVSLDEGPFWYVPKSPVLTERLIQWHADRVKDLKRGAAEEWRGPGHREGSFRISPEELHELEYTPEPVTVEADTLVVANVYGFHRRGDTRKPTHRVSMHGSIRINNPFGYVEKTS